jgi:hypothetical protein
MQISKDATETCKNHNGPHGSKMGAPYSDCVDCSILKDFYSNACLGENNIDGPVCSQRAKKCSGPIESMCTLPRNGIHF